MVLDLEVLEADSEIELKALVQKYVEENADRVIDVQYACYTDNETEELMYSAGIMLE